MGGCNLRNILSINVQNTTEGKFNIVDEKRSKSTTNYHLEPGLYTSFTDIVEAMKTLIQERNNHNENFVTVTVSRRTQKFVMVLANVTSGLAFCSTNLGHILVTMSETKLGYWW